MGFGHAPASQMGVLGPEALQAKKESLWGGLEIRMGKAPSSQDLHPKAITSGFLPGLLSLPWPGLPPVYTQVQ